jgi:hypothetical protein
MRSRIVVLVGSLPLNDVCGSTSAIVIIIKQNLNIYMPAGKPPRVFPEFAVGIGCDRAFFFACDVPGFIAEVDSASREWLECYRFGSFSKVVEGFGSEAIGGNVELCWSG